MIDLEQVCLTREIVDKYYEAMRCANEYFLQPMKEFAKEYPLEFKRLNSVHRKRVAVKSNIEAIQCLHDELYFGTLTYDNMKDRNQIDSKRKEAFKFLNSLFEYVLLVEEYGEDKGRYHVHFVGNFKENKTFNDFVQGWHSRQNIKRVKEPIEVCRYLCKYLAKQIPRIRRNRRLVALEKAYHKAKPLKRTFKSLFNGVMNQNIFTLCIDDL